MLLKSLLETGGDFSGSEDEADGESALQAGASFGKMGCAKMKGFLGFRMLQRSLRETGQRHLVFLGC
jgi:hypothetical protein